MQDALHHVLNIKYDVTELSAAMYKMNDMFFVMMYFNGVVLSLTYCLLLCSTRSMLISHLLTAYRGNLGLGIGTLYLLRL